MAHVQLLSESIKLTDKQLKGWQLLTNKQYKFIKFWGGSRSGKTFSICLFIVMRALAYKNSNHIVCRYDKAKAKTTVWRQTLEPLLKICEKFKLCRINHSEQYARFFNGSMVILGGLRPTDIGNILSAEYATFFCCEANEMSWQTVDLARSRLNSAATRKDGTRIECKFIIDLNPTFERHWSNRAWLKGINPDNNEPLKEYKKFVDLHFLPEDNRENLSQSYLETLDSMTGSRRKRFALGQYGSYDGLVYSAFKDDHIIDDFEVPFSWPKTRGIDFGFSPGHAFVCLWVTVDPSNERVIIYREYVQEEVVVRANAEEIKKRSLLDSDSRLGHYDYGRAICDHDAEDRATLEENGISTTPANKSVLAGIDKFIDFIERGKFHVMRSCVETIGELGSHIWKKNQSGLMKDREVVKENDNCLDTVRYIIMHLFPSHPKKIKTVPM